MKKFLLIGLKDVTLALRDRSALIFMLLAPFLLTIAMGFVTGSLGGTSSSGIEQIPLLIVNQDEGFLGETLVEVFQSEDLADLLLATVVADPASARLSIDADEAAAAVIIPAGFTGSIFPSAGAAQAVAPVKIELYKNPNRPVSSSVVESILEEFLRRVEVGRAAGEVIVTSLFSAGLLTPDQVPALLEELGSVEALETGMISPLTLTVGESSGEQVVFNVMAAMAPGMALLFLMFTVSNGGRSILAEQAAGTLPRLLVSPTTSAQVLSGKLFGIYLTGVLQMLILVLVSTLLFGITWGDPVGVLAIVLAAVFAATGWGMLITALARTPGQVSAVGTAVMLIFGILGGSFFPTSAMPGWFGLLSRITPNAWGLDGFTLLGMGGQLADLGADLLGLLVMGLVLGGVAILLFTRRPFMQK